MSEWPTYSLSDFLLFSARTYYRLFEIYNTSVWPAHLLAAAGAIAIAWLLFARVAWGGRAIAGLLAACWLWVAWGYLLERYDAINWTARWFAIGFAAEALLLASVAAFGRPALHSRGTRGRIGFGIFVFALAIQPLIAPLVGRPWLQVETFAMTPDPTAIATLGLLLMLRGRAVALLIVIPLLWCAITGLTLWTMEAPDALVVPAIALLVLVLAIARKKTLPPCGGG